MSETPIESRNIMTKIVPILKIILKIVTIVPMIIDGIKLIIRKAKSRRKKKASKLVMLLAFVLLMSSCQSMLIKSAKMALPEAARNMEVELVAGRVELILSTTVNGKYHRVTMACEVAGTNLINDAGITYGCKSAVDEFIFIRIDGDGNVYRIE